MKQWMSACLAVGFLLLLARCNAETTQPIQDNITTTAATTTVEPWSEIIADLLKQCGKKDDERLLECIVPIGQAAIRLEEIASLIVDTCTIFPNGSRVCQNATDTLPLAKEALDALCKGQSGTSCSAELAAYLDTCNMTQADLQRIFHNNTFIDLLFKVGVADNIAHYFCNDKEAAICVNDLVTRKAAETLLLSHCKGGSVPYPQREGCCNSMLTLKDDYLACCNKGNKCFFETRKDCMDLDALIVQEIGNTSLRDLFGMVIPPASWAACSIDKPGKCSFNPRTTSSTPNPTTGNGSTIPTPEPTAAPARKRSTSKSTTAAIAATLSLAGVAMILGAVWWIARRRGSSSDSSALLVNGKDNEGYNTVDADT